MSVPSRAPAQPFFLPADIGERYCLFHPHAAAHPCRGSIIYVHPFAEEMNRSRRMAALQSRSLAAAGFNVLQIDLYGCGDSSGDFSEARWDIWKADLGLAWNWCRQQSPAPISLWGLRLGASLAIDYTASADEKPDAVLLWHPVMRGETHLTQFLRIRVASAMLAGSDARSSVADLRAALIRGEAVEVAGYVLSPALAAGIDRVDLSAISPARTRVHWFERAAGADRRISPAAANVIDAWQRDGTVVEAHPVDAFAFWASPEAGECPTLLAATSRLLHPEAV